MLLLSTAFGALYGLCNLYTSVRSDIGTAVFAWERTIPFLEWTIVPYLSIVVFFALSFFAGREPEAFRRHLKRLGLALLISVVCYLLYPLRMTFERPPVTGGFGLLFDALALFDLPYNRAPSLHISVLVILWARFSAALAGWASVVLHAWFTLIGVSVLTTYQHHFIDVPTGLLVAGLCIASTARPAAQ
jgi:membrane-associated phospholipid phosphatase